MKLFYISILLVLGFINGCTTDIPCIHGAELEQVCNSRPNHTWDRETCNCVDEAIGIPTTSNQNTIITPN